MNILDFNLDHRAAPQGDLLVFRLTDAEASRLSTAIIIRPAQRHMIRLLEGEVTGHHHEIVMDQPSVDMSKAIADAAIAVARAQASVRSGKATLYHDDKLVGSLPWLTRTDLIIGFLRVENGPVILRHPEHDAIRLPEGTYYCGRQVESAGAEERVVAD